MELQLFDQAAAFYERVKEYLLAHEAHHNLLIGICEALIRAPERFVAPCLLSVEEAGAPVAVGVMTPPRQLVLSRMERVEAATLIATALHRQGITVPGVLAPSEVALAFAEAWQAATGQPYRRGMAQRIYQLDVVQPVRPVSGRLYVATQGERDLLVRWLQDFLTDAGLDEGVEEQRRMVDRYLARRVLYLWEDGEPRSMAAAPVFTPNGARVNMVYTPPEYRRRGYASACVAALSQKLLDEGRRYCYLFTDLANPTSNHIYQEIGYRPVCDVDEFLFGQD